MVDFLSPGGKSVQRRKGPVILPSIATALAGFAVYTQKGPKGVPVLVTGPDDAYEVFGQRITAPGNGRLVDTLSDYANQGGGSCYIMRYCGLNSAPAASNVSSTGGASSGKLKSGVGSFPAALAAGDTFIGSVGGVAQGTVTIAATPATKTGTAGTFAAVANGTKATFTIFGIPGTQDVTFDGTEATAAAYAAQIGAQLRGAEVQVSSGQVKVTTDKSGSAAAGALTVLGTGLAASLGMTTGAFVNAGPNNVADRDSVQEAELKSLFDTTFTSTGSKASTTKVNSDRSVTWSDNATGSASSVQLTGGTGVAKIAGFDTAIHVGTNMSPSPTMALVASSDGSFGNDISRKFVQVNANVAKPVATAAGGTPTLTLTSTARLAIGDTISITKGSDVQRAIIRTINGRVIQLLTPITVPGGGYDGTENIVQETFDLYVYDVTGLILAPSPFRAMRMSDLAGLNYYVNAINGTPRTPVTVTPVTTTAADPRPSTDAAPVFFTGGSDGDAPSGADVVALFDGNAWDKAPDVNGISIPGVLTDFPGDQGIAIVKAQEAYGERRQDILVVAGLARGTPPTGAGGVKDVVQNTLNLASSYEAVYVPWIKRLDAVTSVLTLYPPEAYVLGIIARIHKNRNFGKAPAGVPDALLESISGLEWELGENAAEYDDFYPANVNAILKFPGRGFAVFGSRTMDPTGEFGQVSTQIIFNVAKRTAMDDTLFINFEDNNPATRGAAVRVLTSRYREWQKAGILNTNLDGPAYYVQCDEKNNTALVRKSGKMKFTIGLSTPNTTEFREFTFEQDTRAIDAEIAALSV